MEIDFLSSLKLPEGISYEREKCKKCGGVIIRIGEFAKCGGCDAISETEKDNEKIKMYSIRLRAEELIQKKMHELNLEEKKGGRHARGKKEV